MVNAAISPTTIDKMHPTFATHDLPKTLVMDYGSVFTNGEFKDFMNKNTIRHVTTSPYHPLSNGPAERAVQTRLHDSRSRD